MQHGGNIYEAARKCGRKPEEILDFSANLSPYGIPQGVAEGMAQALADLNAYPDPECKDLREAIASKEGVDTAWILCGNGAADLLYRLLYAIKPRRVLLPVPSFLEYEQACIAAGAEIDFYQMPSDLQIHEDILDRISTKTDLMIVCNPNNPTGLSTKVDLMRKIVDKTRVIHSNLLIDECFCEFKVNMNEEEVNFQKIMDDHIVKLKSFTKLYAIPGIRLGYCICRNQELLARMQEAGAAWSVNTVAMAAGRAALLEEAYVAQTIALIEQERQYLMEELRLLRFRVFEGEANYLLFQKSGDSTLAQRMLNHGILIRDCQNYQNLGNDYYRIAVKLHEENQQLVKWLAWENSPNKSNGNRDGKEIGIPPQSVG